MTPNRAERHRDADPKISKKGFKRSRTPEDEKMSSITRGARRTVEIWYKLTAPMWTHGKNVKEEGLTTIHKNCPQQKEELD